MAYEMKLSYFTNDDTFPFYIHYGEHEENMYLHGHADFSELTVCLKGQAIHTVGEERFEIHQGDVFVMGNGIVHGYEDTANFKICNIMFRPEVFLSEEYDVKRLPGFHALFLLEPLFNTAQGFQSRLHLDMEQYASLSRMIEITIREYNSQNPGRKTLLLSYFLQIIVFLSRLYDQNPQYQDINDIAAAAAFMENHFMEPLPMTRLLKETHYSQRHFIRLFQSAYQMPPQKYLLQIRLRHARYLLQETDLSITEIAHQCGFCDSNYFSRVFHAVNGISPSGYRK